LNIYWLQVEGEAADQTPDCNQRVVVAEAVDV
jgi:hypothetical protein